MRYSIVLCVVVGVVLFVNGLAGAWSPYGNESAPPNKGLGDGPELPFDPNDYNFLVYESQSRENRIIEAMRKIEVDEEDLTVCDRYNPVTANLLASHDILIVGWDASGEENMKDGLITQVIEQGITGRVILSGHDSDYHVIEADDEYAALPFFIQEIDYVLQGGGTGLIVCADPTVNFEWLPESWGVVAKSQTGANISRFTPEGLDSGIFDGLTPGEMSGWSTSYHNTFEDWGAGFRPFELGDGDEVVVTIGTPVSPSGVKLEKDDGVAEGDCRSPGNEITYTVTWDNQTELTFSDAVIVDYLPVGVTYPGADYQMDPNDFFNPISPDPAYDPNTHSYAWEIGGVDPNGTGWVTITVEVNEWAAPGMTVRNVAKMMSQGLMIGWRSVETPVCCWDTVDPNVIYVDEAATGCNNGTSWKDAYTDLSRAIKRATESTCQVGPYTLLVAQGIYSPGEWIKDAFILPDGVSVYGGFMSGGSEWTDRNPDTYPTVLTGYIGLDENERIERNEVVVMMGDNTRLDGFVVEESSYYGIYGEGVSFALANCEVTDNEEHGVFAVDGDVVIEWCDIRNNGYNGISHKGQPYIITIENCQVLQNGRYGIYAENSTPQIVNSAVCNNGLTIGSYAGILLVTPSSIPSLYNNSIAYNASEGISWVDDHNSSGDANNLDWPDMQNCIVWYNNDGGGQLAGFDADTSSYYCCIQDCNDVNFNINVEPGFAYGYSTDPNVLVNVHLAYDSPCIDMGSDLLSYTGQLDIDAEERVVGDYVDIGADEVYASDGYLTEDDIYNSVDWTADGIVNFHEFGIFARAWLSVDPNNPLCDPENPEYVSDANSPSFITEGDKLRFRAKCDLDTDKDVDMADLDLFCSEWLWVADWKESDNYRYDRMAMATGGGESAVMSVPMTEVMSMDASGIEYIEPEPSFKSDSELAGFIGGVNEIIDFVDATIEQDPSNSRQLYDLKASLEDVLWELYDSIDGN